VVRKGSRVIKALAVQVVRRECRAMKVRSARLAHKDFKVIKA
jgi:hypothetical protein